MRRRLLHLGPPRPQPPGHPPEGLRWQDECQSQGGNDRLLQPVSNQPGGGGGRGGSLRTAGCARADSSYSRVRSFVSPIQQSVYIAAMAVINGATSPAAILKAWKLSILPVMRVSPGEFVVPMRSLALTDHTCAVFSSRGSSRRSRWRWLRSSWHPSFVSSLCRLYYVDRG